MKKNIRSKINRFLESEEGRVSTKAPLTLGIATGSVLLAQMMHPSPVDAHLECENNDQCTVEGEVCVKWVEWHDPGQTEVPHSECKVPGH